MVPFAQERGVVEVGLAAVDPVDQVVDVAPVAGSVAAGEYARVVAQFDRLAQGGRHDPVGAAEVERVPVGPEDDEADVAVAGQPAGACGGDLRPEPGPGGAGTDRGSTR